MRTVVCSEYGPPETLRVEERPTPTPGAEQVLVAVAAAAVNFPDVLIIANRYQVSVPLPFTPGSEFSGVVEAVGEGVADWHVGDRVFGAEMSGAFSEYVVVPAANVRKISASIPKETAAAHTLATLTAWRMVVTRARVTAKDEVLIWGIGGGVALAALGIVKQIGARAWVTSGSDEKLARARELGADETINYRTTDVAKEVRARTGKRGVTVVLDNVGRDTWKQSLGALGRAGRLVTCGATSGPMVETDARRLFWNQWTIMGSTMGNAGEFEAVTAELSEERLLPVIDSVFDLEKGRDAFARLASGDQFGKIVVRVS